MNRRRKVDTSKMTQSQKNRYLRRLAQVRKYTKMKREWERRMRLGEINPKITLEMYRRAHAEGKPIESMGEIESDVKFLKMNAKSNKELDALRKIENLLRELKRLDAQKDKILNQIIGE